MTIEVTRVASGRFVVIEAALKSGLLHCDTCSVSDSESSPDAACK